MKVVRREDAKSLKEINCISSYLICNRYSYGLRFKETYDEKNNCL